MHPEPPTVPPIHVVTPPAGPSTFPTLPESGEWVFVVHRNTVPDVAPATEVRIRPNDFTAWSYGPDHPWIVRAPAAPAWTADTVPEDDRRVCVHENGDWCSGMAYRSREAPAERARRWNEKGTIRAWFYLPELP